MRRTIRLCMTAALAASAVVALPAAADSHIETVLTNLDNPRGLTVDGGDLFVAASGRGGAAPCTTGPEGGEVCYGDTGHIHKVAGVAAVAAPLDAETRILIDNLPSLAGEGGTQASGPADVSVSGATLYYTIGLGADPAVRDGDLDPAANEDMLATLQSALAGDGTDIMPVADLGDHEGSENPDGSEHPDSNPFGVVATPDAAYVLDSGGNTIVQVDLPGGTMTTHTVFPPTFVPAPPFLGAPTGTNIPAEAVPTQLAMRGDGTFDVGQLTGFPFHPGSASVWNVDGGELSTLHTGFTNIMDVAWHDGDLYVLEIFHDGLLNGGTGALIRVSTDGDTVTRELLMDDLDAPGGIAFDEDVPGTLYMSLGSDGIDGSVVRFDATAVDPLVTVVDDTAATDEDERLVADDDAEADAYQSVTADVAANDTGVAAVSVIDNTRGAVYDGSIGYQPPAHFVGEDTITYRGCTDDGACLIGVLHVMVEPTDTDRIAGGTRIETAVEGSMAYYPGGAPQVLVARADLYPDALTGAPLAAAVGGPILLTAGDSLSPATAAELRRLGPTTVHVLGGPVAISDDVFDAIEEIVDDTRRIAGGTRFETAVRIKDALAAVVGAEPMIAYVVEGADPDPNRGWPDAVSVSGIAANTHTPILLAETDRLPDETREAIDGMPQVTVVGGPVAISDAIRAEIEALVDNLGEIAGETRYETSQMIAQSMNDRFRGLGALALVSGGNWPDALVAGPLTGPNITGMLLVHPTDLTESPEAVEFIEGNGPFADLDLWGGTVAISEQVEAGVAAANGG